MVVRLVVCPSCSRHVREDAVCCPFCAAGSTRALPPRLRSGLTVPVLAALAVGVAAGCAYGPPPEEPDAGLDDAGASDVTSDGQQADRVGSDVSIGD